MGRPKALLSFGPELMLQRVVRMLAHVVDPIVVVAAPDQELPPLPDGILIARDEQEYLGPLAGLGVGLRALSGLADAAYCSGCDVPLLRPEFVAAVIAALGDYDAAVPREGDFYHPLAGVYRVSLADRVAELTNADRLRLLDLLEDCSSRAIDVNELRGVDPELDSLRNVNSPEDYAAALRDAGWIERNEQEETKRTEI
jgi:molybdopterin-guanine dinucleotide biosynthesis protein A